MKSGGVRHERSMLAGRGCRGGISRVLFSGEGSDVISFRSAVFLGAVVLAGCASAPHNVAEKYFLVVANTKSPYWEQVSTGLNQAARELGVSASLSGPGVYESPGGHEEVQ